MWSASATLAADAASRPYTKAPVFAEPVQNWAGFYAGAHTGYGWGHADNDTPAAFFAGDPTPYQGLKGPIAGGHLGYNHQTSWLVLGIEGDFSWSGIRERASHLPFGGPEQTSSAADVNWLASVRGRVGAAFRSVLIYGTGGGAWAEVNLSTQSTFAPNVFGRNWFDANNVLHSGWVAGGGAEWMFTPNWLARVEYLHYEFENRNHFSPSLLIGRTYDLAIDVVRGGVSYRF